MILPFHTNESALIVIDVQGRLAYLMHRHEHLFKHLKIMIKAAKVLDIPIFYLEQYPQGLGHTNDEIKAELADLVAYEKITFSSCGQTQFIEDLKNSGRQQMIISGIETHVCVYQTVLDLLAEKFQVAVNQDAVSSRTKANKKLGIHRMEQAGAVITSTEMVLFEMMQTAKHPRFKEISNLLK